MPHEKMVEYGPPVDSSNTQSIQRNWRLSLLQSGLWRCKLPLLWVAYPCSVGSGREKLRLPHPREVVIALLLTTLTGTLTSLWLTSLGMENAMAPRYLISGGPGLGTPFITYLLPGGGGPTPSFLRSPLLSSNPCAVSRFTAARVFNSLGPLLALSFLCNSLSVVFSVFRLTRSETSHVSSSSCILPPLSKMMPARSFLEPPWKPESSVVELPQPS
jgi:hypothetical protein